MHVMMLAVDLHLLDLDSGGSRRRGKQLVRVGGFGHVLYAVMAQLDVGSPGCWLC